MIRKVEVHNNDGKKPYATGHWIEADTEEDILRIVKKYNINNPIGRELVNPELIIGSNDFLKDYGPKKSMEVHGSTLRINHVKKDELGKLRLKSFFHAKVWFEKDGELCSIPIKERYSQLMKEKMIKIDSIKFDINAIPVTTRGKVDITESK